MTAKEKKLRQMISDFCKKRNLDESAYLEGVMKYGPLPDIIIDNMIKYYNMAS